MSSGSGTAGLDSGTSGTLDSGFSRGTDGAIIAQPNSLPSSVQNSDSLFQSWTYQELAAAIMGVAPAQAGGNPSTADATADAAAGNAVADPASFLTAATAFYNVGQDLNAIYTQMVELTSSLVGAGGPWSGPAADAFSAGMGTFAQQVLANQQALTDNGGIAQQLEDNGNTLTAAMLAASAVDQQLGSYLTELQNWVQHQNVIERSVNQAEVTNDIAAAEEGAKQELITLIEDLSGNYAQTVTALEVAVPANIENPYASDTDDSASGLGYPGLADGTSDEPASVSGPAADPGSLSDLGSGLGGALAGASTGAGIGANDGDFGAAGALGALGDSATGGTDDDASGASPPDIGTSSLTDPALSGTSDGAAGVTDGAVTDDAPAPPVVPTVSGLAGSGADSVNGAGLGAGVSTFGGAGDVAPLDTGASSVGTDLGADAGLGADLVPAPGTGSVTGAALGADPSGESAGTPDVTDVTGDTGPDGIASAGSNSDAGLGTGLVPGAGTGPVTGTALGAGPGAATPGESAATLGPPGVTQDTGRGGTFADGPSDPGKISGLGESGLSVPTAGSAPSTGSAPAGVAPAPISSADSLLSETTGPVGAQPAGPDTASAGMASMPYLPAGSAAGLAADSAGGEASDASALLARRDDAWAAGAALEEIGMIAIGAQPGGANLDMPDTPGAPGASETPAAAAGPGRAQGTEPGNGAGQAKPTSAAVLAGLAADGTELPLHGPGSDPISGAAGIAKRATAPAAPGASAQTHQDHEWLAWGVAAGALLPLPGAEERTAGGPAQPGTPAETGSVAEPGVQGAQPPLAARPPYRAADDADPGRERGAPAADGLASTEARARLDEALARSRPESRQPESKHAVAAAEPNGPADGAQPGRLDFGPLLAQDVSLWGEPDEPDLFH